MINDTFENFDYRDCTINSMVIGDYTDMTIKHHPTGCSVNGNTKVIKSKIILRKYLLKRLELLIFETLNKIPNGQ